MLLNGGELLGVRLLRPESVRQMTTNQLPTEALPMNLGGFRVPGMGFGLGVSVLMNDGSGKPNAGEIGWSGAASTFFWVAPKSELIVIVLQQVQPLSINLQTSLKPAIYAAIQD
jgi:CubicO group peptidase (beta-lactamase class C family)